MNCPKCRRKQYFNCGQKDCTCQDIPKGKKHQVELNNDILKCPYCGFKAHVDFWGERECLEMEKLEARIRNIALADSTIPDERSRLIDTHRTLEKLKSEWLRHDSKMSSKQIFKMRKAQDALRLQK